MDTRSDSERQFATVADVARRLAIHPETVKRWARKGTLKGFQLPGENGQWRFAQADVDAFVAELRGAAS